MTVQPSLPDPDHAALERSRRLARLMRQAILSAPTQVIGFDDFMQLALYAPDLGYYTATNAIFGARGDFITAPESGDLFGRCLARQCAEILARTGGGIVEYGGGTGRLAVTLLESLRTEFDAQHFTYHIVEPSVRLRERQQAMISEHLHELYACCSWSEDHPVTAFKGVVIANEMFDAMPARRYIVERGEVYELGVGLDDEQFVWRVRRNADVPAALASAIASHDDGYMTESIPAMRPWFECLTKRLAKGVVLICDYGYSRHEYLHAGRAAGTLKCHYRHQLNDDPFVLPGLQDITTAVNYSDVAEAANAAGFEVAGFTTQAHFLLDSGLEKVMADICFKQF